MNRRPVTMLCLAVLINVAAANAFAQSSSNQGSPLSPAPKPTVIEFQFNAGIPEFSPDGRKLAVWSADSLSLYSPATGLPEVVFPPVQPQMYGIRWMPDGKQLVAYGESIQFFEIARGRVGREIKSSATVTSLAVSPDGKSIACGDVNGTVTIRSLDQDESFTLPSGTSRISDLLWSGNYLYSASGFQDGEIRVWDPKKKVLVMHWKVHLREVRAVALKKTGDLVVRGGSEDLTIWKFDPSKPNVEPKSSQLSGAKYANDVACLSDGETIVSGQDTDVILWSAKGKRIQKLRGHDGQIANITVSSDGKYLATHGGTKILIWKTADVVSDKRSEGNVAEVSDQGVITIDANDGTVSALAVSADGKFLAAISETDLMRLMLWTLPDHKQYGGAEIGAPPSFGLSFAEKTPILAYQDGLARIITLDMRHRQKLAQWTIDDAGNGKLILSRDGRHALLGAATRAWWIDLRTGKVVTKVEGHTDRVSAVALLPDEKSFLTASRDKQVILWNALNGEVVARLPQEKPVQAMALSRDGRQLAIALEHSVAVWDLGSRKKLMEFPEALEVHRDLVFSPDGKLLVAVGYPHDVRIWSTTTRGLLRTLNDHTADVMVAAFSPDGTTLFTGGSDKTIKERNLKELLNESKNGSSKPLKNDALHPLNELANWEIVRGDWKEHDGHLIGSGNSRIISKQNFPNELLFRCKLRVRGTTNPRIRFDAFHFGYEGRQQQFFLYGPKATGKPFPFELDRVYLIEVRIDEAGTRATLRIDGKEVAVSHPKPNSERTLSIEGGGQQSEGSAEFFDIEIDQP